MKTFFLITYCMLNFSLLATRELKWVDYTPEAQEEPKPNKSRHFMWFGELEKKFLETIQELEEEGRVATPANILREMQIPGLTRAQVASHLQKYRLKKVDAEKENKEKEDVKVKMAIDKLLN